MKKLAHDEIPFLAKVDDLLLQQLLLEDSKDLYVLAEYVQDGPNNKTRFWVVGPNQYASMFTGEQRLVSVALQMPSKEPGSLLKILEPLKQINLTGIASRPKQTKLGEYTFFLDFIDPGGEDILKELEQRSSYFRLLGRYPVQPSPDPRFN